MHALDSGQTSSQVLWPDACSYPVQDIAVTPHWAWWPKRETLLDDIKVSRSGEVGVGVKILVTGLTLPCLVSQLLHHLEPEMSFLIFYLLFLSN